MTAMVCGRITSMLEKQEGTPSAVFTFIVTRQASTSIAHSTEPTSEVKKKTLAVLSHDIKNNSGPLNERGERTH